MSNPSSPPSTARGVRSAVGPAEDVELDSGIDEVTEGQILSDPPPPQLPIVGDSDVAEEKPLDRQGEVLAQRYVIKRLIAKGGMGRVYLATQTPLGREVAVKCLIPQPNDKEFRKRFFLEASTCARLTHRHIVTVHDYGEADNGELFMAMEYLRGEPLSRVVARDGRLSSERTGQVALQICRALRAAHRIGVVHRDLKPGNIMLLRDEEQDTTDFIKVLDFGLVKAYQMVEGAEIEGGDLTRAGTWLGSPRYMAPEQIRCRDVDPRTDIYSLGAIVFHMLAGRPPFTGATSVEIFGQHLRDPVPWIRDVIKPVAVAPELETVVRRCLEKDPDRRYQSMDDVIADIKAANRLMTGASMVGESTMGHAIDPAEVVLRSAQLSSTSHLSLDDLAAEALGPPDVVSSDSGAVDAVPIPPMSISASTTTSSGMVSTPAPLLSVPPQQPRRLLPILLGAVIGLLLLYVFFGRAPAEMPADVPVASTLGSPRPAAPQPMRVSLASQPSGAQVTLDGVVIGTTPLEYQVRDRQPGTRVRFDFELAGHVRRSVEAELSTGPMSLSAALEAAPTAQPSAKPRSTPVASATPVRRATPSPTRAAVRPSSPSPSAAAHASPSSSPVGIATEGRRLSVDDESGKVPVVGSVPTVE